MEPQAVVAIVALGLVGFMILASKIFTKIWLYILLLSPSWGMSGYGIFEAILQGKPPTDILLNHASGLLFILAPIDAYLIPDPSLKLYGLALLGIWLYIIFTASRVLLGGWIIPIMPLIFWLLGKGLPNTAASLSGYIPDFLLAFSGLPLVLLACALLFAALCFFKPRFFKRR